jgi:hypothetical protein
MTEDGRVPVCQCAGVWGWGIYFSEKQSSGGRDLGLECFFSETIIAGVGGEPLKH